MKIRILFIIYFFATQIAYSQYSIENLGSQVNTKNSEVRPTISADGKTLYFVVENNSNPSKNKKNDKAKQEAWFTELNSDGTWGQAMKCSE